MRNTSTGILVLVALLSSQGSAVAQVTYLTQSREVRASASADFSDQFSVASENESIVAPDFAPFDEFLNVTAASDVASGTARARQDSILASDRISMSAYADGSTSGGSSSSSIFAFANATSELSVEFQVNQDLRFHVTGSLDPTNSGRARVEILSGAQTLVYLRFASGGSNFVLDDVGFLSPGTYTVRMSATGSGFSGSTYGSSGSLDLDIAFEDVVQRHCVSVANSSGQAATIDSTGSTSVSANDFGLVTTGAPAQSFGLYFYGANRAQTAFGDGSLCVGGPLQRLVGPILIDGAGTASLALDLTSSAIAAGPNPIEPGALYSFQFWFRDNAAGGEGFNTSDAIEAIFTD